MNAVLGVTAPMRRAPFARKYVLWAAVVVLTYHQLDRRAAALIYEIYVCGVLYGCAGTGAAAFRNNIEQV